MSDSFYGLENIILAKDTEIKRLRAALEEAVGYLRAGDDTQMHVADKLRSVLEQKGNET